jgi:predicted nucleotidyltransferase component of viral defense system
MANELFGDLLKNYEIQSGDDYTNAVREIMQQIALAGLHRGGFFEHAAFYGGTCLRMFYGLDRFSEDMDFSLLAPRAGFTLEPWFKSIVDEFALLGCEVSITRKIKKNLPTVDSAFLKNTTEIYNLQGKLLTKLMIKIEVDTDPPPLFDTEWKLALHPYSFMARCYSIEYAYAGKMSAFIYRRWRNRVKGRDWYDFEWYVRKGVVMDLRHYNSRVMQFQNIAEPFTPETFRAALKEKIRSTDMDKVLADVANFVKDRDALKIWSQDYFLQLADLMKIG